MLAVTSTALLGVVGAAAIAILAGVGHVLMRVARNTQRIAALEDSMRDIGEDVRFLIRRLIPGTPPPSVAREREREDEREHEHE